MAMTGASVVCALLVLAAVWRLTGADAARATGIATVVMLVLFQWNHLTRAGTNVAEATSFPFLAELTPVVLAGAILWLGVRLAGERVFTLLIGALVITWIGVSAVAVPGLPPLSAERSGEVGEPGPPTLILVLDAYSRNDFIRSTYGYDNGSFTSQLEARGFTVAGRAAANYPSTWASLSSMLELDYIFPTGPVQHSDLVTMNTALAGESGVVARFHEAGYETVFHLNGWSGSRCGRLIDNCVRDGLVTQAVWNLSQLTIFAPLVDRARPPAISTNSKRHLEQLPAVVAERTVQSRLTVAHVVLPHEPHVFDEDCNVHRSMATEHGPEPRPFVRQLECVNRLTLAAVDAMIDSHPDALIMITGDHGDIGQQTAAQLGFLARMATFTAVRTPGCSGEIPNDISLVNGTRLLAGCALGLDLEPLPNRHYWFARRGFVDITDDVRQ